MANIQATIVGSVDEQSFRNATERARQQVERLSSSLGVNLTARVVDLRNSLTRIRNEIREAERRGDFTARGRLQIQEQQLRGQLRQASAELRNFADRGNPAISGIRERFAEAGRAVVGFAATIGLASQAIRGLRAATDISLSFESAFAGVARTVDATEGQLAELRTGLEQLSLQLPSTFEELSRIAEVGGQLGVSADGIVEFTRVAAGLGEATTLSAEDAATGLARFSAIVQQPISDLENLGSTLVQLGNSFETNEGEILNFGLRIAAAGNIAGLTSSEILGISAAFSSVGIQAEAGGTAVSDAFLTINQAVIDSGTELQGFATVAGVTSQEFATLWEENAGEAFTRFVEGLGDAGDTGVNILRDLLGENARLQRSFLSIAGAGDQLRNAIESANEEFSNADALTDEVNRRLATQQAQLDIQINRWRIWASTIGDDTTPALVELTGQILDFVAPAFNFLQLTIIGLRNIFVGFADLLSNIAINVFGNIILRGARVVGFFQNFSNNVEILSRNIGRAFNNVPLTLANIFNSAAVEIESFLNVGIDALNQLRAAFGGEPLEPVVLTIDTTQLTQAAGDIEEFEDLITDNRVTRAVEVGLNQENTIFDRDTLQRSLAFNASVERLGNNLDRINNLNGEAAQLTEERITGEVQSERAAAQAQIDNIQRLLDQREGAAASGANAAEAAERRIATASDISFRSINRNISESESAIEDYQNEITRTGDRFTQLRERAEEEIAEINDQLNELDLEGDQELLEREVEVNADISQLQQQIRELENEGINLRRAERLGLDTLRRIGSGTTSSGDVEDSIRIVELNQELNELLREQEFLRNVNIDAENRAEFERRQGLTESERLVEDQQARRADLEAQRTELQESITIAQQQADQEIAILNARIQQEQQIIEGLNNNRTQIEEAFTEFFEQTTETRTQATEIFNESLRRQIRLLRQRNALLGAGGTSSGSSGNTTNNNNNTSNINVNVDATINNNLDVEQIANDLANTIELANQGINN